ncbi:hypothetical protein AVEN_5833-1 [Araneus ventricosus]|uniref:Uncharacterized protein n=1 Tax=Araneus ventricosus TaxID=182803 RepID=A0A4Y2L1Q2_ARAVE|nr:hypothetical protein AVEN_5833-1 [Araneus ventricosus]
MVVGRIVIEPLGHIKSEVVDQMSSHWGGTEVWGGDAGSACLASGFLCVWTRAKMSIIPVRAVEPDSGLTENCKAYPPTPANTVGYLK